MSIELNLASTAIYLVEKQDVVGSIAHELWVSKLWLINLERARQLCDHCTTLSQECGAAFFYIKHVSLNECEFATADARV